MKKLNLSMAMALLSMGTVSGDVTHTLKQQEKSKYYRPEPIIFCDSNPPRPSKYPKKHPVAIELMSKAQAKRDRKNALRLQNWGGL